MGRSILATAAGFIAWSVIWVGAGFAVLMPLFGFDPEAQEPGKAGLFVAYLVLSVICSLISGAICALIAKPPSQAPAWLAGILIAVGLMFQISAWNQMPLWYHASFLLLLGPATLIGARIINEIKHRTKSNVSAEIANQTSCASPEP